MNIGYARTTTEDHDPQLQLDRLREASCEQVFEEMPDRVRDRPVLQACLGALQSGDTLVVWKLDRLARSLRNLIAIVDELNRKGVGFRSLVEGIDTRSEDGRLTCHLFDALAHFEHSLIRERTLAGLAAARARGRRGGRKPALSADDVRRAVAILRDHSVTKTDVAKHFKVSRVTLNAALAREGGTKGGSEIETVA